MYLKNKIKNIKVLIETLSIKSLFNVIDNIFFAKKICKINSEMYIGCFKNVYLTNKIYYLKRF